MSNVPEGAQVSDDGQWWWDGENWQAVEQAQSYDSGATDGGYSSDSSYGSDDGGYSSESSYTPEEGGYSSAVTNLNPNDFPSLARVLYFGGNVDAYLSDLGIDPAGIDDDDSPNVA